MLMAKKQLLASLDTDFYDKVITPLRLDVELAKVELEDIFAHILDVWEQANTGRVKRHVPSADKSVLYSGLPFDMDDKALISNFQFHIDAANKVLPSLCSDENANDEPTTRWPAPPTRKPGFWHDSANCPTADIECDECVIEQADDADGLVSAFQTAFDAEDDTAFARLCAQHDHPLVRQDEEPFTFPEHIDVGFRAQYAELTPYQPSLLATRVHEARTALRELKQVAGGAESASQHFPMVHFGSATPAVIDESIVEPAPQVVIEADEDAVLYPKHYIDDEPPFEQSFMDGMSVKSGFFEPEPMKAWPTLIDTVTASALCDVEIAPRSVMYGQYPVYQNCTVDFFTDTAFLDTGPADFDTNFSLDSGFLDSVCFDIYGLDFEIENYNATNFCELYSVDHFRGG
ncbi:hypothetical protein CYMTET_13908 [Cymbomonas tetramitiformis]|uniref:Uncharacterized protein n=1 Tax=Cymbomonas tetramitiformis TaxID=36881 RepID=A0AAE0LAJ6_9CHLO|nr:hypothetical protein CYMTET_13908 [Cymbomonas tetramitiformis]